MGGEGIKEMAPNVHGTGLALTGAYLDEITRKRIDDAIAHGHAKDKADLVRLAVDMFLDSNENKKTQTKQNGEEK